MTVARPRFERREQPYGQALMKPIRLTASPRCALQARKSPTTPATLADDPPILRQCQLPRAIDLSRGVRASAVGQSLSVVRARMGHIWEAVVTPVPLILFVWGILLATGLLPSTILIWRVPPTAPWRRARLIVGVAAIVSGGFWLALDLVLPIILPRAGIAARLADIAGWTSVIVAAATCVRLIASRPSDTVDPN